MLNGSRKNKTNGWYKCSVTLLANSTLIQTFISSLANSASMGRAVGYYCTTRKCCTGFLWLQLVELALIQHLTYSTSGSATTRSAETATNSGVSSLNYRLIDGQRVF